MTDQIEFYAMTAGTPVTSCNGCGVVVVNQELHKAWHSQIDPGGAAQRALSDALSDESWSHAVADVVINQVESRMARR